ncbi:Actin- protein 6, partial [Phlyctochytrium planicorne]
MMEETFIVNEVKEACCYVSVNYDKDVELARYYLDSKQGDNLLPRNGTLDVDYALPDFRTRMKGAIQTPENKSDADQCVRMGVERFMVPELMFNPSNIGIPQAGLPEAVSSALSIFDDDDRGPYFNNVVVCGGNFNFKGAVER